MKGFRMVLAAGLAATALPLAAQQGSTSNMEILREKVKTDRKVLVAENLKLSDAEGKNFWPIYDAYQKDLSDLNSRTLKLITDYADEYNKGRMSNEAAGELLKRQMTLEDEEAKLRRTYIAKAQHVLPAVKAARWAQIESKIRAAVKYDLASSIPLVE